MKTIGDLSLLPEETREAFEEAWEKTKNNTGMTLVVAVNYGSRQEILRAVNRCAEEVAARTADGLAPKEFSAEDFERGLYTAGMPDPERRGSPVELPSVAGCLFGVRRDRCAVAGLRPLRAFALPARVSGARSPFWGGEVA